MRYLVGCTGFVGSNICQAASFDGLFRSTDVQCAYGKKPDLLIYAGLRAEKFLANSDPEQDMAAVKQALDNIRAIAPRKLVLISTVDVYKRPVAVDETTPIDIENLQPYGLNRYWLEQRVREEFQDVLIVRLPGLYGINLKKNFLFDLIHRIPTMLKPQKFEELLSKNGMLSACYKLEANGFYKIQPMTQTQRIELRTFFAQNDFSAVSFTDSRASYQLYPLRFLWGHIESALAQGLRCLNIAVEPLTTQEIYQKTEGTSFCNEIAREPVHYDMRSCYASALGGMDGYLLGKEFLLEDIVRFVREEKYRIYGERCV